MSERPPSSGRLGSNNQHFGVGNMTPADVLEAMRERLRYGGPRHQVVEPRSYMLLGGDDNDNDDDDDDAEDWAAGGRRRQRGRPKWLDGGNKGEDAVLSSVWARGNRGVLRLTLMAASLGLLLYLGVVFSRITRASTRHGRPSCDTTDHGYQCYRETAWHWGQYSPFFSVNADAKEEEQEPTTTPSLNSALPPGCRYTFAQVLSRHAARDPTAGRSAAYSALVTRLLASVRHFADGPDGHFAFLNDYTYRLGADELTRFGEQQMVRSGAHFYRRYRSLVEADEEMGGLGIAREPFVRSADQNRVVVSAINWLGGFEEARGEDGDDDDHHHHHPGRRMHILLLSEADGANNTLSATGLCPAFSSRAGLEAQRTYAATFVPAITARLNRGMPGADLTDTETLALMDLCPFETVADEHDEHAERSRAGARRLSPFCALFSADEWRHYDYFRTLGLWYGHGGGSALGATQGVGFVNELVARLTGAPVADGTSTNRTLDADPATFPLDATVYADFSHDNDMVNIFTALGLYGDPGDVQDRPQPSNTTRTEPGDMRGFAGSWVVPFAARLYVEKMVCDNDDGDDELVRILVNDRVVPLAHCGADALGRCRLGRFIDSLAFARGGGHWEECFA